MVAARETYSCDACEDTGKVTRIVDGGLRMLLVDCPLCTRAAQAVAKK